MSLAGWILLLLVVAAVGFYVFRRRRAVRRPPARAAVPPPAATSDELSSLGLSEVRVAGKREEAAPVATPDEPARAPAPPARPVARPEPVAREASADRARPAASSARPAALRTGTPLWEGDGRAVAHLLASLAEHVGGTVAVLREDDGAYVMEAVAGRGRELSEPIQAEDCPLHRAPQDRVLTVLPDNLKGLSVIGDPPRAYARALAEPPADRAFLVVGTEDADEDPALLAQIERYADLLAALTTLGAAGVEAADVGDEPEPASVPRATIIRREQEAAQEADRSLAFALVTLAHAEDVFEAGADAIAEAENKLRARLAEAPSVRRVEPFGDLLMGVFLDRTPEEMAAWCTELSAGDPPLFIGAVAPAEGEAEAVRAAAVEALHDAYDQRRAQIVTA